MDFFNELAKSAAPFFESIWAQMALLVIFATVHGYLGAWIAVRMLFRPRRPFKVFGLTFFPQGMIPRHRDRLAAAIGRAVGDELVSQETIMDELIGRDFLKEKIRLAITDYAEELIATDYPSLIESLPAVIREPVLDTISALQLKLSQHISAMLNDRETQSAISEFVEQQTDILLSRRLSTVLKKELVDDICQFLSQRVAATVNARQLERFTYDFISRRIDELIESEVSIGDWITQDARSLIKEKASEQISPISERLAEIAAEERTRQQIAALVKREVHSYYENLPFFKKIFVSRENLLREVDHLVNQRMPQQIEQMLRGELFQAEAGAFIDKTIDEALAKPLKVIIGGLDSEVITNLKRQIADGVIRLIRSEAMISAIGSFLRDAVERLLPHSIDSILRTINPETEAQLKKMLSSGLIQIISSQETIRLINEMIAKRIEELMSAPIGRISDRISEETIVRATQTISEAIIGALKEKLPEAIKEFDLARVVEDKVKNYPVEKLEELVLSVAREHLRTIELFGALFGLIIGLAQAVQFYFYAR